MTDSIIQQICQLDSNARGALPHETDENAFELKRASTVIHGSVVTASVRRRIDGIIATTWKVGHRRMPYAEMLATLERAAKAEREALARANREPASAAQTPPVIDAPAIVRELFPQAQAPAHAKPEQLGAGDRLAAVLAEHGTLATNSAIHWNREYHAVVAQRDALAAALRELLDAVENGVGIKDREFNRHQPAVVAARRILDGAAL